MQKERIKQILDEYPDEVDLDDFSYRLALIKKIDIGEQQFAEGNVFSHEEAKQMLKKYL